MKKIGSSTLPKEDPIVIKIKKHIPWLLLASAFIYQKLAIFFKLENKDKNRILIHFL